MKKIDMTYQELAKQAGTSYATIHRILNGKRRPSPELAERLEKVTGVPKECWIWPCSDSKH